MKRLVLMTTLALSACHQAQDTIKTPAPSQVSAPQASDTVPIITASDIVPKPDAVKQASEPKAKVQSDNSGGLINKALVAYALYQLFNNSKNKHTAQQQSHQPQYQTTDKKPSRFTRPSRSRSRSR